MLYEIALKLCKKAFSVSPRTEILKVLFSFWKSFGRDAIHLKNEYLQVFFPL